MEMFVSGQLTTQEAVAEHLGVSIHNVINHSRKHNWAEARKRRAEQLIARVAELPSLAIERSKEGLEEIGKMQEELAKSLIGHASLMISARNNAISVCEQLCNRISEVDPGASRDSLIARLECVKGVAESFSDHLRILAGMANPDKAQRQQQTKPQPNEPQTITDLGKVSVTLSPEQDAPH